MSGSGSILIHLRIAALQTEAPLILYLKEMYSRLWSASILRCLQETGQALHDTGPEGAYLLSRADSLWVQHRY
jgi:hypothetical protein